MRLWIGLYDGSTSFVIRGRVLQAADEIELQPNHRIVSFDIFPSEPLREGWRTVGDVRRSAFVVRRSRSSCVVRRSTCDVRGSRFDVRGWTLTVRPARRTTNDAPQTTHLERRTMNREPRTANQNAARRTPNDERSLAQFLVRGGRLDRFRGWSR